ncbi:MAG: response regulator [Candidatus Methanoperedens sp.]|nr:response regulator [Candidatus Methanoperedens sp.]
MIIIVEEGGIKITKTTKVLVIEPNSLNMELAFEILNSNGFTVDGAKSGADAYNKIEKQIYDFILMEPRLPDADGFSIAKAIKNNDGYKNVPLIALTAYAMKGDKERILNAGFDDYIPKPINVHDLMAKVEKYRN